jgi:predicted nucleotide-binding protein
MSRRLKKNVFLVHGADRLLKNRVVGFVRGIGLNPIVLHDQLAAQQTVIDRFEHWTSDTYILVLLSEQDLTSSNSSLLFELGYLVGRLGRRYVTVLHRHAVTLPPILSSILCIPLDEIGIWKFALIRDLAAADFAVRPNLALYDPNQREGRREGKGAERKIHPP